MNCEIESCKYFRAVTKKVVWKSPDFALFNLLRVQDELFPKSDLRTLACRFSTASAFWNSLCDFALFDFENKNLTTAVVFFTSSVFVQCYSSSADLNLTLDCS